jgi:hypothetical protein
VHFLFKFSDFPELELLDRIKKSTKSTSLIAMNFPLLPNRTNSIIAILCVFFNAFISGQDSIPPVPDQLDDAVYAVHIHHTNEKIVLDGEMNEGAWQQGKASGKFWQNFPGDSIHAKSATEMYMTYDDENLYIAIVCHSTGNDFVTPSLRRDYGFGGNDNFSIHFDTYNDNTNSAMFGINPFGIRREALISGGGRQISDFNSSWDNKWSGNAKIYDKYWIGEYAIPFKTLRYNEGSTQWRFAAYRNDTQTGERSTWLRIPQNRVLMDMSYMGKLIWDKPLKKAGKNISIIPFVASSVTRDFEDEEQSEPDTNLSFGGDAKIAVTSGLNLDLTINPDFSQVEVDQQVTNLNRFEIFFPERRQFFLENADLFSGFGAGRVTPFFSRRIGVTETSSGDNVQNTILYGARLSGKLNERTRIGLLNMQTAKQVANDLPSFNYTVATAEQNIFAKSTIAAIVVNKQAINSEDFMGSFDNYNRVAGLEYRLATQDNVWTGKTSYFQAFTPSDEKDKFYHFLRLEYNKRRYRLEWAHYFVGSGFDAQVGFIPRKDILFINPELEFNFFPKRSSRVSRHRIQFEPRFIYKTGRDENEIVTNFSNIENQAEGSWNIQFRNTSNLNFSAEVNDVLLLDDFDPTRIQEDGVFLAAGERFQFTSFRFSYSSDRRKKINFNLRTNVGQFYGGNRSRIGGSITYRYQPFGFVSLAYNYNRITNLGDEFEDANLWLLGPRIDITFTKKLFLTTFIQYNSQSENLNINTRFQWRFAPVSDFFLVYTDNQFYDEDFSTNPLTDSRFTTRNRALVAKVTYWLNL